MKIYLLKAVTVGIPVLDEKGKPVPKVKTTWRDREHLIDVFDHVRHAAGSTVDVPDSDAKALIAAGHARASDPLLDDGGEGDPLK